MKVYLFIFLLIGINCFKEWWQNSNIPDLTSKNFFEEVGKDKWVFVKFYTTWCGYCRKMAPEFDKLYDMVVENRKDIIVRRIEGDSNEEIPYAYDIHSYPKLVLFKPGSVNMYAIYQGYRIAEEMLEFLNKYAVQADPVKDEVFKIEAVKDNKTIAEDMPKAAPTATLSGTGKANKTRTTNTTRNSRKSNQSNVEEFKNKTEIKLPIVEEKIIETNDTIVSKKDKSEEYKVNMNSQNADNETQLLQTEEVKQQYAERGLEEIVFLKDEVKFLSQKLGNIQAEIQMIKSSPQTNLKIFDLLIYGVIVMVILAIILTIKKLFNKLKVS